ncbi:MULTISPECIES: methyltransferase [unclassified Nocardioides]|uniref:RraA family protein n=1 Tax=unclassified Nocardioides TaxID=2615069 RepID=UPI0009EFE221|nr:MULTISPECIES: methyltransferase [unclassified Nocardioides]GAW51833.1 Demethylmenaquinone methyltransferase [Nocardioides sp. PD653-B2]GAW53513.1 Demethylmenaquinone methyltransferase [Nocardioides sp. PD653]
MTIECIAHPEKPLPPPDLLARLQVLATSLVSDVSARLAGAVGIAPVEGLAEGQIVTGPALTVRTRPGDNLVVHKALDVARPGEILVVDAGGSTDRAILGGLMGRYAASRGIEAIVVDGAVRDRSDLRRHAPPVFAAGVSHLGPYKDGPGELRGTVSIGGVPVRNGDLIVADEDGVAVIPLERAEEIIALAEAKADAEGAEEAAIADGTWDRSWIDRSLSLRRL